MCQKLILILLILFLIYISHYKKQRIESFFGSKKIYLTLHHKCNWISEILLPIFENILPHRKVIIKPVENPDVLIMSHFFKRNPLINEIKAKNIITYSGESYPHTHPKSKLNFISHITNNPRDIWFPFILSVTTIDNINILLNKKFKPINDREKLLVYLNSNCTKKRDNFFNLFQKMSNNKGVSLGKCLQTHSSNIHKKYSHKKIVNLQNYKFVITMENLSKPGYCTEKIFNAYLNGCIPIYWGCSDTVSKFFNPETYIDLKNFKNEKECIEYILDLAQDEFKMKKMQSSNIFKNGDIHPMLDYRNPKSSFNQEVKNKIKKYLNF